MLSKRFRKTMRDFDVNLNKVSLRRRSADKSGKRRKNQVPRSLDKNSVRSRDNICKNTRLWTTLICQVCSKGRKSNLDYIRILWWKNNSKSRSGLKRYGRNFKKTIITENFLEILSIIIYSIL